MNLEAITQKLDTDIQDMISFLTKTDAAIKQGTPVQLTQLDNRVLDICHRVESLPAEEGKKFQERLQEMIAKLDELAETIKNNANIF